MKLKDIERVNHLVGVLEDVKGMIKLAEAADMAAFQLSIAAPGDASLRMSAEGDSTTHSRGIDVSTGFLAEMKDAAVRELHRKKDAVLAELTALGVEPDA